MISTKSNIPLHNLSKITSYSKDRKDSFENIVLFEKRILRKPNSNSFKFFSRKKAISPIAAIALLLVLTTVSIVGFQTWSTSYQDKIFSNVETNGKLETETLRIDSIIGNSLYIFNDMEDNLKISELKISGNSCTITNNLTLGMNEIPVSSCISSLITSDSEIVLVTEKKVIYRKIFLKKET